MKNSKQLVIIKANNQEIKDIIINDDRFKKYKKELIQDVNNFLNYLNNSKLKNQIRIRKIIVSSYQQPRYRVVTYATTKKYPTNIHLSDKWLEMSIIIKMIDYLRENDVSINDVIKYFRCGTYKDIKDVPITHIKSGKIDKNRIIVHHLKDKDLEKQKIARTTNKMHIEFTTLNNQYKQIGLMVWNQHKDYHRFND